MVLKIGRTVIYIGLERRVCVDVWRERDYSRSLCIRFLNVIVVISRTQ